MFIFQNSKVKRSLISNASVLAFQKRLKHAFFSLNLLSLLRNSVGSLFLPTPTISIPKLIDPSLLFFHFFFYFVLRNT